VYSLNSEKYGIHNPIDRAMNNPAESGHYRALVFSPDLGNEWRAAA
jgi:hypothetical protein